MYNAKTEKNGHWIDCGKRKERKYTAAVCFQMKWWCRLKSVCAHIKTNTCCGHSAGVITLLGSFFLLGGWIRRGGEMASAPSTLSFHLPGRSLGVPWIYWKDLVPQPEEVPLWSHCQKLRSSWITSGAQKKKKETFVFTRADKVLLKPTLFTCSWGYTWLRTDGSLIRCGDINL